MPKLHGFSSTIVPPPADWDECCHVTGYWFLATPDDFTPPTDLLDFLEDGDPPVSIGFGSMASRDAEAVTAIALTALQQTGQRGLLLTGWGGISQTDLPDREGTADWSDPADGRWRRCSNKHHYKPVPSTLVSGYKSDRKASS